jgi:hypothetical protein
MPNGSRVKPETFFDIGKKTFEWAMVAQGA